MRLVGIGSLRIGAQIGWPIFAADGRPLVRQRQIVDTRVKCALQDSGVSRVYIADVDMTDVDIESALSHEMQSELLRETHEALSLPLKQNTLRDAARRLLLDMKESRIGLQTAMDIRPLSAYLAGHSVWGAMLAVLMGRGLQYSDQQLLNLAHGMLVRDVGTRGVRDEVLSAERMLSEEEYREAQQHARHGFKILRDALQASPLARSIALYHHERLDGSGYPRGVTGEEIPEFGRIGAIADVYDALTSDRPHRLALPPDQAIAHILARPEQFDASLARTLAKQVAIYPPGITVTLDTGDVGIVVNVPRTNIARPVVRVLGTLRGVRYREPRDMDLSRHTDIKIITSSYDAGM